MGARRARLLMTGENMGARGEKMSAAATALRASTATTTAAARGTPPRLPPAASISGSGSGSAPPRVVGCVRWSSLFRVWAGGCVLSGREGRQGRGRLAGDAMRGGGAFMPLACPALD